MSAKWRALQHRHRYTYSAVVFPPPYTQSLPLSSSPNPTLSQFYTELHALISLNSIYSQVEHAKKLTSSLIGIFSNTEDALFLLDPTKHFMEILFLENSMPLHRTLVSALAKVKNHRQSLISACFRALCEEYGGGGGVKSKGKRFAVSRVALSILSVPKLGYLADVVKDCAVLAACDGVSGLNSVVKETEGWSRSSLIVMEQCQDALSCLYYLLQRFPDEFKDVGVSEGDECSLMEMVFGVLVRIMKSVAFSRDCFVAAGVSFCVALQVCLSAEELGLVIMKGIFCQPISSEWEFVDAVSKLPYKGEIVSEIQGFSVLSRLCLIRGILTAVSRTLLNTRFVISSDDLNGDAVNRNCSKTILYDAILPELCSYCENPMDSHFNFHALTVMQICLQQIKTSVLANIISTSDEYKPIKEEMGNRILRIMWKNLEDPLSQTVKQVHLIFDLFLDIQPTLCEAEDTGNVKLFLRKIASDLLCLGSRCKGRYIPLASLTKRLGAKTMLDMSPLLLYETVQAYMDDDVCGAATSFLKCFLENLRDECWSSDGIERGYELYRGHCLPPLLHGLVSGMSKLRSNLNTYALPIVLEVDVDSIFPLLAIVSVGPHGEENDELGYTKVELTVEQKVAVLLSLLKVSRSLALIEGDIDFDGSFTTLDVADDLRYMNLHALVCIKGINFKVRVEWLVFALTHADESLRVDAAESLFLNPKTASLPSCLELTLMKEAVPLNMRCSSTGFQMKWTSLFRKFFARVRTALERQFKQGSWQPLAFCDKGNKGGLINRAENLFNFMRWLSCFLFFSCYPSAPYRRKIMAMELILIMMSVWSVVPSSQEKDPSFSSENALHPYSEGITSPESTLLLVGSIIDSWDRLRENSFRILLNFPAPLPGISSEDMVHNVVTWAKKLVCSPRVRESDAGALTFRLIFRKYVLELQWMVGASVNGDARICKVSNPVMEYIRSLIDWLDAAVKEGEKDLYEACKNSFVHGVLLAIRYTFEELDWNSDAVLLNIPELRLVIERLLELVMRITSLALCVVSADAWFLPEDMDDMVDDDSFLLDAQGEGDLITTSTDYEEKNDKIVQDSRQSQTVMVGCWLAMKEVSLLLGTVIRKAPLPSNNLDPLELRDPLSPSADVSITAKVDTMLDFEQLEKIGNHFLEVILKMKHNGAIDKTRAGFTALCNRLLCSNDPRLCKLTETWMSQLMERTVAKDQVVNDLLRRSAGIPAAFTALFLAEPEGTPKKLLPQALRWLIDVAKKPLLDPVESSGTSIESESVKQNGINANEKVSKVRDEGVVPTVHAFNVLRAAFNDANLSTDTSGFAAEALIVSIRSFASPYWEVRNSACQAYTALVRRMVGFLNVRKRESGRRALTGVEFFQRYPSLHLFIYNELRAATELLGDTYSEQSESNLAKVVHPSLCPVLILLARLKPSTIASGTIDDVDPFMFSPFIRKCSTQNNLRVRVLASRALTGLISYERLPTTLLNIASELPCSGSDRASFNLIHGVLLQSCSLLDANCRNLSDLTKKNQIIGDLIRVLGKCSWVASPRKCPCPLLNASFLRVLDHMLSITRTGHLSENLNAVRNLLLELSTDCLDVEASYGLSYYDPTIAELREQAAISYFGCVFKASEEDDEEILRIPERSSADPSSLKPTETEINFPGLKERLFRSLHDSSYEVRLATLKWLLKLLKGTRREEPSSCGIGIVLQWIKTDLQETMTLLLDLEKNHRCTCKILRILYAWNFQNFQTASAEGEIYVGNMDQSSVVQFWDKLVAIYKFTRHTKTREALICCMAICVKKFSGVFTSSLLSGLDTESDHLGNLYEYISYFIDIIKQHSSSSEPVTMRVAAAQSIVASGLLEQGEAIGHSVSNHKIPSENSSFNMEEGFILFARKILEIWFQCISLLEDEDDWIKQNLALDVSKFISSQNSETKANAGGMPIQVDKVIRSSFRYLSSVFGHWIDYFDFLLRWVMNASQGVASMSEDLVRKVFDKEIDNHHEEKLLITQICCFHLEKLPTSSWAHHDLMNTPDLTNYMRDWRMRFYNQLAFFAREYIGKQGDADWIGGVSNHKDAFLPIYGNLLGFFVVSKCIFNCGTDDGGPSLLSEAVELGKIIDPFLRNPLISNLYLLVLKLHEDKVYATVDLLEFKSREDLRWREFGPYFLIR